MSSRGAFWIALFAGLPSLALQPSTPCRVGRLLFQERRKREAREDYDAAFDNFQKACARIPGSALPHALYRVRVTDSSMHLKQGPQVDGGRRRAGGAGRVLHAAEIDPGNEAAQQEIGKGSPEAR